MTSSFPIDQGSTWRKWDLHIHTPVSLCSEYGGDTPEIWQKYFMKLEELSSEIKVIGINDYLFLDGYKRVLEYQKRGGLKNVELILPVVEFRLKEFVGHDKLKRLNYHIIFGNETLISVDQIESQFISGFRGKANLDPEIHARHTWGGVVTRDSLTELGKHIYEEMPEAKRPTKKNFLELGFNNINFELSKIESLLGELGEPNTYLANKYFKAIGKSEWEQMTWDSAIADKKSIINNAHFVFAASPSSGHASTAKQSLLSQGVNTRLLHCSDAHMFPGDIEPTTTKPKELGHCFTWIKADPTFEGLRQIVFEPDERIRLQATDPALDFDKPVFKSICFDESVKVLTNEHSRLTFSQCTIPLNPNLVAIIGGRGQGKSMLINFIGNAFNKALPEKLGDQLALNKNAVVSWKQSHESTLREYVLNEKKDLPFTFIYQSKIKEIADDPVKLKDEVLEILKDSGYSPPPFKTDDLKVKEKLQHYWNLKDWLQKKDGEGNLLNDPDLYNRKILTIQENIELVTDRQNRELLDKFIENIASIAAERVRVRDAESLLADINDFMQKINARLGVFAITNISIEVQVKEINEKIEESKSRIGDLTAQNDNIREENFKDFKGDLVQLLNNLETDRKMIDELRESISEIRRKQAALVIVRNELNDILSEYRALLGEEVDNINKVWKETILHHPLRNDRENAMIKNILANRGISISAEIFFNKNLFSHSVERMIDGRVVKSKKDRVFELLKIAENPTQGIVDFTMEKIEELYIENGEAFYDGIDYHLANVFLNQELWKSYLFVRPRIQFDGRDLEELSAGQKGTIYLCLKLATQLFSGPLIFDQPEDDLDNSFINNELIDLFKDIKKFRQVIIVSHNANLVVNADAEQVIIADNNKEVLQYKSGSLENDKITFEICQILEGGHTAFEKRRSKYRSGR